MTLLTDTRTQPFIVKDNCALTIVHWRPLLSSSGQVQTKDHRHELGKSPQTMSIFCLYSAWHSGSSRRTLNGTLRGTCLILQSLTQKKDIVYSIFGHYGGFDNQVMDDNNLNKIIIRRPETRPNCMLTYFILLQGEDQVKPQQETI